MDKSIVRHYHCFTIIYCLLYQLREEQTSEVLVMDSGPHDGDGQLQPFQELIQVRGLSWLLQPCYSSTPGLGFRVSVDAGYCLASRGCRLWDRVGGWLGLLVEGVEGDSCCFKDVLPLGDGQVLHIHFKGLFFLPCCQ